MKGFPVWFDGNISQNDIKTALEAAGLYLRARNGIMFVAKIPESLKAEPEYEPS